MGALFSVGILLLILLVGLVILFIGIIQYVRRKKSATLITGGMILAIPLALLLRVLSLGFAYNTIGFQRVGEYIEGGYQPDYFSIKNVSYYRLRIGTPGPFHVSNSDIVAYWEERNSSGWLDCGNYYRLNNAMGFDLLCTSNGALFCSSTDLSSATEWYQDTGNYQIYLQPDLKQNQIIPLSDMSDNATVLFLLDDSFFSDATVEGSIQAITMPKPDELQSYALLQISSDAIVELDRCYLYKYDSALYLSNAGAETQVEGQKMWTYYLKPIPQEISDELLSIISATYS